MDATPLRTKCLLNTVDTLTSAHQKWTEPIYPQSPFPYERLVAENRARGKGSREFELADTGVFDQNRYFDVFVELC